MTDAAHTPIREPQSVARLSRTFSRSLSAVDLAEPLASLDENQPVALGAELMRARNVNVLGVRREGLVAGWVGAGDLAGGTLGERAREFRAKKCSMNLRVSMSCSARSPRRSRYSSSGAVKSRA